MKQERGDQQAQSERQCEDRAAAPRPPSPRRVLFGLIVIGVIAAAVTIGGIVPRVRARARLKEQTNRLAPPDVLVRPPQMGETNTEIVLPGNIYAFTDSPIYARTDGYLEKWYFDIGARVRKGQLLATISTPELDRQVLQARADLATAEANAGLAKINSARYRALFAQNGVSKQDTDSFVTQEQSTSSAVRSAQANLQRLEQLQSFEKVYAPFDGVITARNIDIGQLIDAGTSSGAALQLFHMASIDVLRVYVNVPQIYSRGAVPGTPAVLTFSEFPGESFPARIVRTANAIDPVSRTLLVEVDVNNRDRKLMPGAFTQVHLKLNPGIPTLIVPVAALIFRTQGLQLGIVVKGPRGDQAKLVNVTVDHDDGTRIQVITGLDAHAQVIQNPPDSLIDGEQVHVVQPQESWQQQDSDQSSGNYSQ